MLNRYVRLPACHPLEAEEGERRFEKGIHFMAQSNTNKFLGFDVATYPGDAAVAWLWTHGFRVTGFYLNHHRGGEDDTWILRRSKLVNAGWGLAPLYLGWQTVDTQGHHLAPPGDPAGTAKLDSAEAASLMSKAVESRLFKGRKVMVFGQITDKLARDVVARILALVDESAKPIQIYVNSPGGHVESGDSIHDIIKFVRSNVPIYMIGTGWVASAGALIYAAGEKRFRFCLPNTRFLLHQPMGGVQGPATDIDIEAREIIKMRERLSQIIATETGQSIERVRRDTDRNYWMSASEAIDYGLASKIVHSIEDLK